MTGSDGTILRYAEYADGFRLQVLNKKQKKIVQKTFPVWLLVLIIGGAVLLATGILLLILLLLKKKGKRERP